jgi:hypothetical protein
MKKFLTIFFFVVLFFAVCCVTVFVRWVKHHGHLGNGDISLQIKESENRYQIYANYNRDRTAQVRRYLDTRLHTHDLFRNSTIDADVVLEDNTKFYVKNTPGKLVIKFNRDDNSEESFREMKRLAEGLKMQITNP